jgi:hypothetical protein
MMSTWRKRTLQYSDPVGDKGYQFSLFDKQDRYPQTPTRKARPGVPTTITDATQPTPDGFVIVA